MYEFPIDFIILTIVRNGCENRIGKQKLTTESRELGYRYINEFI